MRRTLSLTALLGLSTALLAAPVASASTTAPAQATSPYAAYGTGNLLEVHSNLAVQGVADVFVSPVATAVDTGASPRSNAQASNLGGTDLLDAVDLNILSTVEQSAPEDNPEGVEDTTIPVDALPLLNLDVSTSSAHARWPGDGVCVAPNEPISQARSFTAGADVLALPGGVTVASVVNEQGGVSGTSSEVYTTGDTTRSLVSETITQIDEVSLLTGTPLELHISVADQPTLTATASGQPGGAEVTYNDPLVTIEANGQVLEPLEPLGPALDDLLTDTIIGDIAGPLLDALLVDTPLADLLTVELTLGSENLVVAGPEADGTAVAGAVSVVYLNIEVLPALATLADALGENLVGVQAHVGPMTAGVVVPQGGIDCTPDLPACSDGIDNDGEGTIDIDDPNCHTDGDPNNPDSFDPNDDDESSECNDGVDNADPEDDLADAADPGCHTDGDPNNPDSYDPNGPSETNEGQPRVETPAPLPRTGGDMPLAAAMAFGGLGLAALHLMRRRITA